MKVIRFLKAFRGFQGSFLESLTYELDRTQGQVAAMPVELSDRESLSLVGLLLTAKAVSRVFEGDVWSLSREDGSLYPTRSPKSGGHAEAFCRPDFKALVIDIRAFRSKAKKDAALQADIKACIDLAKSQGLGVFVLKSNNLISFKEENF